MELLFSPQAWIGLFTLIALEVVLGIDNVVFISIVAAKLPLAQQSRARRTGLALVMLLRILLLLSLTWVMGLTQPLLSVFGVDITGREIILIPCGLVLVAESSREIHL